MRICHITPHLPPDQAANALLPAHLGAWALARNDEAVFVAHPPRQTGARLDRPSFATKVHWVDPPSRANRVARSLRLSGLAGAIRVARAASAAIASADLVHVHSNGLISEIGALMAARRRKPFVLTLYGTEIWHYNQQRRWPDLFTRAYRHASVVTFYSHGLRSRAIEFGLERLELEVIYPPVADEFQHCDAAGQAAARAALGIDAPHLLVNVKRLHPLAGQRFLIEALPAILRELPGCRLVICGTGQLRDELEAIAGRLGVAAAVTFTGLVDNAAVARYDMAADLFVLPSLLEACPTVALEALACGTPVVSSDNPGGVELAQLFGNDVRVVPRENPEALARAIVDGVRARRRVRPETTARVERELRGPAVAANYYEVYHRALAAGQDRQLIPDP